MILLVFASPPGDSVNAAAIHTAACDPHFVHIVKLIDMVVTMPSTRVSCTPPIGNPSLVWAKLLTLNVLQTAVDRLG